MPTAATEDSPARRRARAGRIGGLYAVTPDLADTADLVARAVAMISAARAIARIFAATVPASRAGA